MDLEQRRELNNGFGESLAKAIELVTTPAIFGFLGYLLDRRLGTTPLFLLLFALVTFFYLAWKSWGKLRAPHARARSQAPRDPEAR